MSSMDEFFDSAATDDYRRQSREFLSKSRDYLAAGDLHQASEKGRGTAARMVKLDGQGGGHRPRMGIPQT